MSQHYNIDTLLTIMTKLRDPENGCPWDLKQTFASIVSHTIEEAYEVAECIEQQQFVELKDELGDLLFQIVFYAQLGKEQQLFEFDDVVSAICDKLIRRHPHVFDNHTKLSTAEINANWEAQKSSERQNKALTSVLDDIPLALPALSRAQKNPKACCQCRL
jgi:ATP diphosphatase